MRKLLVFTTLLIAAFAFAVSVSARGKGAVKIEFSPNVGSVILNTTASGKLNASAHVHNGLPNENFLISVRVRYENGSVDIFKDIATLSTNGEGKGNVQVQVDTNPPAGSIRFAGEHSGLGDQAPTSYSISRLHGTYL